MKLKDASEERWARDAITPSAGSFLSAARTPWATRLVLRCIRGYRRLLSPLNIACCRFRPTCSEYGLVAFQTHSFWRAWRLTVWRILRCNPWGRRGPDPVPPASHLHRQSYRASVHSEVSADRQPTTRLTHYGPRDQSTGAI